MAHGFGKLRVPVTVVGCIHYLGDTDGVEHIGQDCFLGLAGKADLLVSLSRQAFSITYFRSWGRMSPKCLHGESLSVPNSPKQMRDGKLESLCGAYVALVSLAWNLAKLAHWGMETSWRHQLVSGFSNEGFFSIQ